MKNHLAGAIAVGLLAALAGGVPVMATQPIGVTTQPLRSPLPDRVTGFQLNPHFLLMIGVSREAKHDCADGDTDRGADLSKSLRDEGQPRCEGYDIFETINTFAPAVLGKPSQSGWHDHPIPVGFVQVIQGTLWTQDATNPGCLKKYATGAVLIEHQGDIHNAFNFDSAVPTVLRSVFFVAHDEPLTRTDRPDPITGDPDVASAPPTAACSQ
jgi:hypothetical protein